MSEERRRVWVYSGKHHVGGIDVRATFDPGVAEMFRQDGNYDVGEYVDRDWVDGEGQEAAELIGDLTVQLKEQEERCERLEEAQLGEESLRIIETALVEWGEQNCGREDFTECGDPFCHEFAAALEAVRTALQHSPGDEGSAT